MVHDRLEDISTITSSVLYNFRLGKIFVVFYKDLGWWVKPRSTTWFYKFLIEQYDNDQWLENFYLTKASVFSLDDLLQPLIEKKNTN
jgi:hypothetical protein